MSNTKFVLTGGGGQLETTEDVNFYRECVCDIEPTVVKVLSIPFAAFRPSKFDHNNTVAEYLLNSIRNDLLWVNPHKAFDMQSGDWMSLENLSEQFKWADLIFVHGGNGDVLQDYFTKFDLAKHIEGKTCAGFSAGANMWAAKYYSNDNQKVMYGLGVLDVVTFCHYENDKWPQLNQLIASAEGLPVITLSNEGYVVVCN